LLLLLLLPTSGHRGNDPGYRVGSHRVHHAPGNGPCVSQALRRPRPGYAVRGRDAGQRGLELRNQLQLFAHGAQPVQVLRLRVHLRGQGSAEHAAHQSRL
jgi:hypothetical protein